MPYLLLILSGSVSASTVSELQYLQDEYAVIAMLIMFAFGFIAGQQ